jgi:hypothetical protein
MRQRHETPREKTKKRHQLKQVALSRCRREKGISKLAAGLTTQHSSTRFGRPGNDLLSRNH